MAGMATFTDSNITIVNLELFDAAFAVVPGTEDEVIRRFMTLFVYEDERRRGGSADVCRSTNALGETFALKRLRVTRGSDSGSNSLSTPARRELRHLDSSGANQALGTPDYVTTGHMAAFYEEYRIHLSLSSLRGFPKLYGFGLAGGDPVFVMEWVDGVTLSEAIAARRKTFPDEPLPLTIVADLGLAVIRLLRRAGELSANFVHRDLSPRNVMLRTDDCPADEQLSSGRFDLCLIDFGSSALADERDGSPSFTMGSNIWRLGTPAYAPPEMLSADIDLPAKYRQSPTIDVYALCSMLYELYAGQKPYEMSDREGRSPYRIKTETAPRPLEPRNPDAGALAAVILTGLSPQQEDRPSLAQLEAALVNWKALPGQKVATALSGTKPASEGFWQPGYASRSLTRRRLLAGGIVAASAAFSVAIVSRRLFPPQAASLDESRYPRAVGPYEGDPLFKAYDASLGGWMLCDSTGTIICRPESSRPCGPLREGVFALYDDISRLWGFAVPNSASDGYTWRTLPSFAQVRDFSEGLAAAQDPTSKLWGYVDAAGTWAMTPRFRDASDFSGGAAAVQDATTLAWGAIDDAGSQLVNPQFASLGRRSPDGYASAQDFEGEWGIVDERGAWSCEPHMSQLRRVAFGCAPALDGASDRWGFVDANGTWTLPPAFLDARAFFATEDGNPGCLAAVQDASSQLWYLIEPDGTSPSEAGPRFWKLGDLHDGLAPAQASSHDDVVVFDESDPDARAEDAGMRYGYVDRKGSWQMRSLTDLTDTAIGTPEI